MLKRKLLTAAILAITCSAHAKSPVNISLQQIGTYETGVFAESAAEIVAYDEKSQQLFVINAQAKSVDILDISDPTGPLLAGTIDVSLELPDAGGVNSVAVHKGLVAIAVENVDKQQNGWAALYDVHGNYLDHYDAGALPDMITFTPDGRYVLVANEGEPGGDYTNDPEGLVTIIELKKGAKPVKVRNVDFRDYNEGARFDGAPEGVRISGPGASVAQDIEPEYIAVSADSKTAWVTLQENNAMAIIDIKKAELEALVPLGSKDHSVEGFGLDASNEDGNINIQTWPVHGTYMPDGIAAYESKGKTYLITANEGDGREYLYVADTEGDCLPGHDEDDGECTSWLDESRVRDIALDPDVFPDAANLKLKPQLGRLKVLNTEGDLDNDGDYDELHAFGARSISIWNHAGELVADTGDMIEQVTALVLPDEFNSTNDENGSFDSRSDDKGPEPEGVAVGKLHGRQFAFVGLERIGGVMIFDVTDPAEPRYVGYTNNRDFLVDAESGDAGDFGPEGLLFIARSASPNHQPLLVVGNEVSGSTTIYQVVKD
jgi:DNA-binding beta-propeller fold protein YncE